MTRIRAVPTAVYAACRRRFNLFKGLTAGLPRRRKTSPSAPGPREGLCFCQRANDISGFGAKCNSATPRPLPHSARGAERATIRSMVADAKTDVANSPRAAKVRAIPARGFNCFKGLRAIWFRPGAPSAALADCCIARSRDGRLCLFRQLPDLTCNKSDGLPASGRWFALPPTLSALILSPIPAANRLLASTLGRPLIPRA